MKKITKKTADVPLLGAHTSIAGGFDQAIDRALLCGFTVMQIFVKSNRQWFAPKLNPEQVQGFLKHPGRSKLQSIFAHNSYLINLAASDPVIRGKSIQAMVEEVQRAMMLELPFIVLHPGAHMGVGVEKGIRQIVDALNEVVAQTRPSKTRLALESTAGQGTTIGHAFEHLAEILSCVRRPERFSVCLDTAHLLAAGYDITSARSFEKVMKNFDRLVGLKQIAAFHLNDSKVPLGSHRDRHEHIGKGYVGLEAFRFLLNDSRFKDVPKVLETPKSEDMHEDVKNLKILCSLLKRKSNRLYSGFKVNPMQRLNSVSGIPSGKKARC